MEMTWRWGAAALSVVALAGCGGLTQMQDGISKFDQGAHAAATAEMDFFRAVQTADCSNQFYTRAFQYATGPGNFDLSGSCTPSILDDPQIEIRQALMDAMTLYADKMAALATDDRNKTLDANSQKLASNLNSVAKKAGFFSSLTIASGVESAIVTISEMALDQRRFRSIKKAAAAMQGELEAVIDALKVENTTFAVGIASKTDDVENELRSIVALNHKNRGSMSLYDIVEARRMMQGLNPFGAEPLAATPGAGKANSNPGDVAARLNDMLDAVANANDAIAHAGTGGIIVAVNDLIARAHAAQTLQSALNK